MKHVSSLLTMSLLIPVCAFAQQAQPAKHASAPRPAPKPLPVVSAADEAVLVKLVGDKLTVQPQTPRKLLVFWKCEGFVHGEAQVYGNKVFELAAKTGAFTVDFTTNYLALTDQANLFKYDALVLNNTTRLKTQEHPQLVPNLLAFVKAGRGLCAIHAAADNFYESPEAAELVGGLFDGHPWGSGKTWAFKLDLPEHPLNRALKGSDLKFKDEIYQQKAPYDRSKVQVLVSLDLSDAATASANVNKWKRADKDFAVSWIHSQGDGRVFYTSFAHDKCAYMNPATLGHILDGLQYVLGDLKLK